ncbi:MAG: ATPase, T2SS/T4P/T4SS family [Opitutaceae bacterium]
MVSTRDDYVVRLLLEKGLVDPEVVDEIRGRRVENEDLTSAPRGLIDLLISERRIEPAAITQLLAAEFRMPIIDFKTFRPDFGAIEAVPREMAERFHVLPLSIEGNVLRVAISDPLDVQAVDTLSHVLRFEVEPHLAAYHEISEEITRCYGVNTNTMESFLDDLALPGGDRIESRAPATDIDRTSTEADAPIIRLVHVIITEAFRRRASDIHLEPLEKRFRVRYRIDGVLQEVENPPKRLQMAIISRVKIMSNISIAEKRVPQDGRIQLLIENRTVDLRVSSLPTAHGESIVMRILDKEGLLLGLPELGFFTDDQSVFERLITLPDGIILVTGPTGSGKTTTLYACLNEINRPDRKIITVEDPVEYQINGINQVPVRQDVGMTFSSALRAMLRQAPNIIMIGEIRDLETAEIAINASLTGHLVFSTLHTNDAPSAVSRLVDLGVKPFLVATSLRAAMAQRLVRKVCKACAEPVVPEAHELAALNLTDEIRKQSTFRKGMGCVECSNTGYRGRMGIFEIFLIDEKVQELVFEGASSFRLRQRARELGMHSMREDGIRKSVAGLTTLEEVIGNTVGDLD